ncbi:MAG: FAD-dependent oxidoreductase, partial [Bacteroidia bacterium]|nr:FAD-dependent oxidoreductase [Bacteroidia bacterium]
MTLQDAGNAEERKSLASEILAIEASRIDSVIVRRRSIDARQMQIKIRLSADVYVDEKASSEFIIENKFIYQDVSGKASALIIGCGPAGMFAALRLIELGIKPVILERGKDVRSRRRDLAAINRQHIINPDSNYCFGEGGAGTYSDGKLYTRSTKRGNITRILEKFVHHGASYDILIDAHPHIGTNKLPQIVTAMREAILEHGGEIHFNTKVTGIISGEGKIKGVQCSELETGNQKEFFSDAVILATGHSARDIFNLLSENKFQISAKPFAMGIRIEHPQSFIDEIQYHAAKRNPFLPPAAYNLSCKVGEKGVYSFCMCPGGIIAPAATAPGEVVVNGWSPSRRNNPYANSGIVVSIDAKDYKKYEEYGELSALQYQMNVEQKTFQAGGGNLSAPAQRLTDFIVNKKSPSLPSCSYIPGIVSSTLDDVLPSEIIAP